MAMAKPIIASDVNDLSIVLDECGLIVEPGNIEQLQRSILRLHDDDELRNSLGERARERCVEKYSYDALSPVIDNVVRSVL